MSTPSFLRSPLCLSLIPRLAAVTLIVLARSSVAFCNEIDDAVGHGDLEKVKALLKDNPGLVFSKDTFDQTPLFRASGSGASDMVKLLIANRADVNAKNAFAATPLLSVVGAGGIAEVKKTLIVKMLLDAGAETNAIGGTQNETALIVAARNGQADVVRLLVDAGADKERTDKNNFYEQNDYFPTNHATALIYAASEGHTDVVKILLDAGADKNAKDYFGHTALEAAEHNNHLDSAELLRQYGGRE